MKYEKWLLFDTTIVAKDGGEVNYRGQVYFGPNSQGSISHIECDTIIMDEVSPKGQVTALSFS